MPALTGRMRGPGLAAMREQQRCPCLSSVSTSTASRLQPTPGEPDRPGEMGKPARQVA